MNNFPSGINKNQSPEKRLDSLHDLCVQLWVKNTSLQSDMQKAVKEISFLKNKANRLEAQISSLNGHTSEMPDNHGRNGDHDRRYVTRNEQNTISGDLIISGGGLIFDYWSILPNGYNMDTSWDQNLNGAVAPSRSWKDPPYGSWVPDIT